MSSKQSVVESNEQRAVTGNPSASSPAPPRALPAQLDRAAQTITQLQIESQQLINQSYERRAEINSINDQIARGHSFSVEMMSGLTAKRESLTSLMSAAGARVRHINESLIPQAHQEIASLQQQLEYLRPRREQLEIQLTPGRGFDREIFVARQQFEVAKRNFEQTQQQLSEVEAYWKKQNFPPVPNWTSGSSRFISPEHSFWFDTHQKLSRELEPDGSIANHLNISEQNLHRLEREQNQAVIEFRNVIDQIHSISGEGGSSTSTVAAASMIVGSSPMQQLQALQTSEVDPASLPLVAA